MWRLEAGALAFAAGDYQGSISEFDRAEELFLERDRRAAVSVREIGAEGAGALVNANVAPYNAFCRDRIMIPLFRALGRLGLRDTAGCRVELFRIREIQARTAARFEEEAAREERELEAPECSSSRSLAKTRIKGNRPDGRSGARGYGNFFNRFAALLSGVGYVRDNDGKRGSILNGSGAPSPANPCPASVWTLAPTEGRAAGAGRGKAVRFPLERVAYWSCWQGGARRADRRRVFPVMTAWPVIEYYPSAFSGFSVSGGGREWRGGRVADMDAIFAQEFERRFPGIVTRIVINTLIKDGAYYGGIVAINTAHISPAAKALGTVGLALGGAAYGRGEHRRHPTWELLPRSFCAVLPMRRRRSVLTLAAWRADLETAARSDSALVYINARADGGQCQSFVFKPLN